MSLGNIRPALFLALCIAIVLAALPARADEVLDLPIGDPARRDRSAPILLDAITDTAVGDQITPAELAARLDGVRMLLVGESHTSMEFHRVQLRILQELVARGRKVSIGLEMYPVREQSWLDRWSTDPSFDEELFVRESHWYRNWTYHWNYYREIFRLAHERGLPMYGLNVPREIVQTMRKEGRQALTEEQANLLPERIETENEEHRRLFRAFFADSEGLHGGMTDEQFEGMFRAQCTWDGAMAHNALRALAGATDDSAILVVLVGSGHVAYGLGVERQARLTFAGRIASVLPIEVEDEETDLPVRAARASYASFFWGIPLERDPLYPALGVSLAERPAGERLPVLYVASDSVAEAAGFEVGDILQSMDGVPIDEKETLHRLMAGKRWADGAKFSVRRGAEELELVALFRRSPPEEAEPEGTEPEEAEPEGTEPDPAGHEPVEAGAPSSAPTVAPEATHPMTPPAGTGR